MAAAGLALAFLACHLPYLPASLEDLDSINFALGIRDFDVAEHRPHPPGYPLFILAAKGVDALVRSEVHTLSLMGVVSGAVSAFALLALFGTLGGAGREPGVAVVATLMTLTAPLLWVTAARPLSDMTGLAASLAVQGLLLRAPTDRALVAAAFLAGLAAGIRSQVVWLTVPLLALALLSRRLEHGWRERGRVVLGYVAGVAAWALPLVMVAGGPAAYWQALAFQGTSDLTGVTMLSTTPTIRQFLATLQSAFVWPWALGPLAAVVLASAAVGAARLWRAAPRSLGILLAGFGPYLFFNMLFQETVTTRYALPLVVPVAYLSVQGIRALSPSLGLWVAGALACFNVPFSQASLAAYAQTPAPAFRLINDMADAGLRRSGDLPVLAMHRREEFDMRRPFLWAGDARPQFAQQLPSPPRREWLELVNYWNSGGRQPVWFVADPLRSDLALVHHGSPRGSYRWPLRFPALIGGVRPNVMDWYELRNPAWYLGEGWALTPEAAGVGTETGRGPNSGPIEGWIRRTDKAATLMVGGRNFGEGGSAALLSLALDGRLLEEAEIAPGFFLRMTALPAGALSGSGDYARLTIAASGAPTAIEQFDAQPSGEVMFGFAEGWHEHEYNPATGQRWRWTADRAIIRVRGGGRPLSIAVRGESEAGTTARVRLLAGNEVLGEERVDRVVAINARIPAAALRAGEATIALETDQSFVPAERQWRSRDRRRLGLKIYVCEIRAAS
jgi:hypothetical protein